MPAAAGRPFKQQTPMLKLNESAKFASSNGIRSLVMTLTLLMRGLGSVLFVFSFVLSRNQGTNVCPKARR
jgi:hypothetical protein